MTVVLAQVALAAPGESLLRGSVVHPPPTRFHAGSNTGSRIIFLNRCIGGCVVEPGFEDSRTNHSSIVETTRYLSEFKHSDEDWQSVVECVRKLYVPFDLIVTDVDPGLVEHSEAMIAGTAVEAGFLGAGGVAPFTCGFIDNAITFIFANNYENLLTICNVTGQETAHGFGLDHELLCEDPLTYLGGCPYKSFQDKDARCGEYAPRNCECGGPTQNSFRYLDDLFGAGIAPTVVITAPLDKSMVGVGFAVTGTASDDGATKRGELWIDGTLVASIDAAPYDFEAPSTLAPGEHEVEVRVFDDRQVFGSQMISVEQEACISRYQCAFAHLCVGGQCTLGPGNPSGLGAPCDQNDECQSQVCARDRNLPRVCTAFCDLDPQSCPPDYQCVSTDDGRQVCMLDTPRAGGGFCSAGSAASSRLGSLLLMLLALCGTRGAHGKARNRRP